MNRQAVDLLTAPTEHPRPRHPQGGPSRPQFAAPATPHRQEGLRVLVVEANTRDADTLLQGLTRQGYVTQSAKNGAQALRSHCDADLVLLDLDLPDLDGLEVCRGIRTVSETPIITVTARDSELDRVLGLQAGADDYLVKPYGFRELLARMEAIMRRVHRQTTPARVAVHQGLRVDADARTATLDDEPLDLTRKEFDLLFLLASQPDTVISRRQIMAQVWGDAWSPRGRTIDTHVGTLRGKLGSSEWIHTVRGIGFRLGCP
ncbi:response regulator transcription factor [Streptomyces sp. NPDC047974]|uniref:response regulator transcription factor n=1 Tax=Streptomyces sp. NPDC047974 TaxID=3154343 RepID=UPI003404C8CD